MRKIGAADLWWSAACRRMDRRIIVRDSGGQALAYVYFEDQPGRRSAAELLTRD